MWALVRQQTVLENLLPGPAELSASNGLAGTQVVEGSGQLQDKEVAQSIETSESATSDIRDIMIETSEVSDKLDNESSPNLGNEAILSFGIVNYF